MSRVRVRWFACQTIFGPYRDRQGTVVVACGYEGRPEKAARPRPSTKPVFICPSCLEEVKQA